MEFFISAATAEDVPGLMLSAGALFREDGGRRDPFVDVEWPERDGRDYYTMMVDDPGRLALTARLGTPDGLLIGHLTGQMRAPDAVRPEAVVADLVSMRVAEEWRGRGVGERLADRFLDWAREKGANRAVVSAYAANSGAIRFYRARGFVPMSLSLQTDPRTGG
ncbi:hypothetical protein GCM10010156_13820 [Planobispora rosea]|uniref:N-acetyltransferase domain-containing protein n=1 Tax=Planobispora rosea TaxID=35762 RepID=A0A8J3RUZ4_PLARO|nr:GNAT family N-acetyltransferase [Planobispora rosea]GGS56472.1 hypothetical protein GCM10010156_13820 [Planobispora rosea]GIH83546.1 hypothetical protein Pro02_19540 [Planobispora rosea]